jgi:DNA-binding HxlR family transcriptional regulator
MKGYGQFCPVALATELLCERWTLLVVRELVAGSTRFNELRRGVPLMSPSLLTQRLRTLEEAGVVDRIERAGGGVEYRLTEAGRDLRALIDTLGAWGARWSRAMREEDLDPGLLMWDVRRRLDLDTMPRDRLIVLFEFDDLPAQNGRRRRPAGRHRGRDLRGRLARAASAAHLDPLGRRTARRHPGAETRLPELAAAQRDGAGRERAPRLRRATPAAAPDAASGRTPRPARPSRTPCTSP